MRTCRSFSLFSVAVVVLFTSGKCCQPGAPPGLVLHPSDVFDVLYFCYHELKVFEPFLQYRRQKKKKKKARFASVYVLQEMGTIGCDCFRHIKNIYCLPPMQGRRVVQRIFALEFSKPKNFDWTKHLQKETGWYYLTSLFSYCGIVERTPVGATCHHNFLALSVAR